MAIPTILSSVKRATFETPSERGTQRGWTPINEIGKSGATMACLPSNVPSVSIGDLVPLAASTACGTRIDSGVVSECNVELRKILLQPESIKQTSDLGEVTLEVTRT